MLLTTFLVLPFTIKWELVKGRKVATMSCKCTRSRPSLKFVNARTICYTSNFFLCFADTKIWTIQWLHVAKYCMLPFIRCNRSINHWIKWVMIIALKAFSCFSHRVTSERGLTQKRKVFPLLKKSFTFFLYLLSFLPQFLAWLSEAESLSETAEALVSTWEGFSLHYKFVLFFQCKRCWLSCC